MLTPIFIVRLFTSLDRFSRDSNHKSIDGNNQSIKSVKPSNGRNGNQGLNQNKLYKEVNTKTFSLVGKRSEHKSNAKKSNYRHKPTTGQRYGRSPVPSTRPLTLGSIGEQNTNELTPNSLTISHIRHDYMNFKS